MNYSKQPVIPWKDCYKAFGVNYPLSARMSKGCVVGSVNMIEYRIPVGKNVRIENQVWHNLKDANLIPSDNSLSRQTIWDNLPVEIHNTYKEKVLEKISDLKLNWNGWFSPFSGYGIANLGWMVALDDLTGGGVTVGWERRKPDDSPEWKAFTEKQKEIMQRPFKEAPIGIIKSIPPIWKEMKGGFKIGYSMTESDMLGKSWVDIANGMDALFVPCAYSKEAYLRGGVGKPIYVVTQGFNEWQFPYLERPKREVFTFGTCGYLDSRKNYQQLVQAFKSEFTKGEPVRLVMKNSNPNFGYEDFDDERIKIVNRMFNPDEMAYLYYMFDCFVFPSKGEGSGLPPREAMATGCPAIVPDYSGTAEIANEKYAYVLHPTGREKDSRGEESQPGQWATYDVRELMYLMRQAYENKDIKEMGKKASDWMHREFTWEKGARKMIKILEGIDIKASAIDTVTKDPAVFITGDTQHITGKCMNLTVIIPLFNQHEYLHRLLVSLAKSVAPEQVLVMDDCSPDPETQKYLEKAKSAGIRVVRNRENLGFGANCNKGVKLAKTKYIALFNSDITIPEDQNVIESMFELIQDEKNGLIGTMLLQEGRVNHGGVYMDWDSQNGTPRHRYCGDYPEDYMRCIELQDFVTGALWLFRKDDFLKLGGFYRGFGRGYFEDPDYCIRVLKSGKRIVYDGRVWADHVGHVSFKAIEFQYWNTPENLELFQRRCKEDLLEMTKNRVGIYTAIAGGLNEFVSHPLQAIEHRYYRFKGLNTLSTPVLQAKYPKLFPEKYLKEDITIWIDGNIQITSEKFAEYLVKELGDNDMMTLNIEGRKTLEEELEKIRKNPKHNGLKLEGQLAHYRKQGLKKEKLFGNGIIVRRSNDKVKELMKLWWAEIEKWGYRDQISLPYAYYICKDKPKIKILDIKKIRKYCIWKKHLK